MKPCLLLAAALSVALPVGSAVAHTFGYSGDWPVTITGSQNYNGAHCIVLSDGGALMDKTYYGAYQVIGRTMLVFLDITGSGDEPATLLFSATASNAHIHPAGAFEFIQGGTSYDSGTATFGTKGGC
jgi:hypothetical protein